MEIKHLEIQGALLLEPSIHPDARGYFFESYCKREFDEAVGTQVDFVQDNQSKSLKGVLRGLHYQLKPRAQGKLVRVISGEVFDVIVDIRRESPTFGRWIGERLSAENKKQLWIPEGCAHGILTLSDYSEFIYKTTDYYAPEYERVIHWDDPDIAVVWPPVSEIKLSKKDQESVYFRDAELF